MGPLRWGIGKLVCDTASAPLPPIVLPFHHRGTEHVMPIKVKPIAFRNIPFLPTRDSSCLVPRAAPPPLCRVALGPCAAGGSAPHLGFAGSHSLLRALTAAL